MRSTHLPRAILAGLLALACAAPVRAATPSAATQAAPAVTPAEAQQLLSVLNDPARRAAFTTTLENLAKATGAGAAAAGSASAPASAASGAVAPAGFKPDSLGAELLLGLDQTGKGLAQQARDVGHTLHDFRNLGPWAAGIEADPARRATVFGALTRLVVVLVACLAVVYATRAAIRRPIAALSRLAEARPPPPPLPRESEDAGAVPDTEPGASPDPDVTLAPDPDPDPNDERASDAKARRRQELSFVRLLHAFRRLPFALIHFGLQLLPVIGFTLTAFLFEFAGFVPLGESLIVVRAAINSFVVAGILIALMYTLLAPRHPPLRLLLVTDEVARRDVFWLRLMIVVGAWGFAAILVMQALGLASYTSSALARVLVFVEHTLLAVLILRTRREVARRLQPPRRLRGALRPVLVGIARRWWIIAIFFDYAFWLVWAAQLHNGYARLWRFTLDSALVLIVARFVGIALLGGLERLFRIDPDIEARHPWLAARSARYYPVLRRLVNVIVASITVVTLLEIWGLDAFSWFRPGALGGRVVSSGIAILVSLVIAILVWESVNTAFERHLERLSRDQVGSAAKVARVRTLLPMLRIMLMIFILAVLGLTVLSEIGVNIAPLLGGAGIVGVAIGFGSQKLVQDFITGIFLLLENTMQVGDWVTLGGLSGTVEHLSIRAIRLRAGDGSLHTIPFSSVTTVTNTNRGLGNAAVSVDLDPAEDTDRAGEELKAIAREMQQDETFATGMISELQLWGVTAVSSQAVTMAGQIVCTDSGRWGVQREFNRRMKRRFQELGIRLAAPTQSVLLETRAPSPPTRLASHARAPDDSAGTPSSTTLAESPPPAALGHDS